MYVETEVNTLNKAYKFRIYPNAEQRSMLAKTFGCVRLVYNYYLDKKICAYSADKTSLSYVNCANDMAVLKKSDTHSFLKEVDSIALQQSLRHLDTAFQNFFRSPKVGFPKFKSKKSNRRSYTTVCVDRNIKLVDRTLALPKIGKVKIKQHRQIPSDYKLKSVTVSQTPSGKYYASILYEYDTDIQRIEPQSFIGLDFSMHELYKDSNGNESCYPRYYRQAEKRLVREQRKLSLMKKGSNNRNKQRIKVARLHEKVSNQRKDFLHKHSRQIANAYDCVCVEDLDMKSMSQALNFGKSVSDNGWGLFLNCLQYKLAEQGKQLVKIDRFYASSQLCSNCGYKNTDTRNLSVRAWDCPECGAHHDRDVNAAVNIRNEGMRLVVA